MIQRRKGKNMSDLKLKQVEKVVEVPLKLLMVDYDWNCRGTDPSKEGSTKGEGADNEFESLCNSIEAGGQIDAVTLSTNKPDGKPCGGDKLFLVAGFRRARAIQAIAEKKGNKEPTIRAIIKTMNPIEMLRENMTENLARLNLQPAVTTRTLVRLRDTQKQAGMAPTGDTLGMETGLGRVYANKLLQIHDALDPKVFKEWVKAAVPVGVEKMLVIAKKKKEEQEQAFTDALPTAGRGAGGGGGKKAWLKPAAREAERVGKLLGHLEYKGLIKTDALDFGESLEECIKMGIGDAKATEKQRAELVEVIQTAYETALAGPPPEPTAEEIEAEKEAKKAEKAAAKAKSGNGKQVSASA
jgi:hypothetical protein